MLLLHGSHGGRGAPHPWLRSRPEAVTLPNAHGEEQDQDDEKGPEFDYVVGNVFPIAQGQLPRGKGVLGGQGEAIGVLEQVEDRSDEQEDGRLLHDGEPKRGMRKKRTPGDGAREGVGRYGIGWGMGLCARGNIPDGGEEVSELSAWQRK